jgi:hypothetical protein
MLPFWFLQWWKNYNVLRSLIPWILRFSSTVKAFSFVACRKCSLCLKKSFCNNRTRPAEKWSEWKFEERLNLHDTLYSFLWLSSTKIATNLNARKYRKFPWGGKLGAFTVLFYRLQRNGMLNSADAPWRRASGRQIVGCKKLQLSCNIRMKW